MGFSGRRIKCYFYEKLAFMEFNNTREFVATDQSESSGVNVHSTHLTAQAHVDIVLLSFGPGVRHDKWWGHCAVRGQRKRI